MPKYEPSISKLDTQHEIVELNIELTPGVTALNVRVPDAYTFFISVKLQTPEGEKFVQFDVGKRLFMDAVEGYEQSHELNEKILKIISLHRKKSLIAILQKELDEER